ncbi:hypothetical protein SH1V18_15960 [Vallitalea longa]|uniref:Stage 0 sporulation protein A homolog n=1 Tax=Vallitalea longa TaxID=2936439 RepID=A0A9W6DDM6_9FIRM|nr:response regulator [Vallitalea longa]GKX29116.1 hypothetical protein SH1V18_15960 [Vallitalea longa]
MYKLLIVDDEHIEIEALKYIISNSNLPINKIETANNGRNAIQIASSFSPDFIIMDIKMPGISGIEAAKIIKETLPYCKIIFLSAYNYFDFAKEAITIGASDFLIKPVSNENLISVLEKMIKLTKAEFMDRELKFSIECKFKQISTYFENELINYLLFAECKKSQIIEYFNALNIDFDYLYCLVMELDSNTIHDASSLKETMIKRRAIKIIKQDVASLSFQCLANYNKNMIYALLLTKSKIDTNNIETVLRKTSIYIESNLLIRNRLVISHSTEDLMGIKDMFINYKQYLLTHPSLRISCEPKFKSPMNSNQILDNENKLLENILILNESSSLIIVKDYVDYLYEQDYSLDTIKQYVYDMLIFIKKSICIKINKSLQNTLSINVNYKTQLKDILSKSSLYCFLQEQVIYFISLLKQHNAIPCDSVIDRVCNYINNNYMNNISLKQVSNKVNLSSHYLSKLFKEQKLVTFSDYLSQVRINKSKELLKNTDLAINVIGLKVGYNDSNYFTRAFKNSESITPKDYRNAANNYLNM